MNRRSLLIGAGGAALAGCASGTPAQAGYPHAARIDAAAAQALTAAQSFPGLAIAIYTREGGYARAFGVADIDTGEPATQRAMRRSGPTNTPMSATTSLRC